MTADLLWAMNVVVLAYYVVMNSVYVVLFLVAAPQVARYMRRTALTSDYRRIMQSRLTWPISVLVPAYNERDVIVDAVRSLLATNYPEFEIIVVNDGSTDDTLQVLIDTFGLRLVDRVYRRTIPSSPIYGMYSSPDFPNLVVVDKRQRGKPDALNVGINVSRYPLFCSLDADSMIEREALLRVVRPFIERPDETVAAGGIVRIANGCEVRRGQVTKIRLPARPMAIFQVVEYIRSFYLGRVGWHTFGGNLVISGAFGVFRKDVVVEAGGYENKTDTEDLELVVRLHRRLREQERRYRMPFVPDSVCWTEAPGTFRQLAGQRRRWQRGLLRTLWTHRRMMLNPRYGAVGMLSYPYHVMFEAMGPMVELAGYAAVLIALALGVVSTEFFFMFLVVALLYGAFLSLCAVMLEEIAFRRYPRWFDVVALIAFGILDNLGYRQLLAALKIRAQWDVLRRRRGWGDMSRSGFAAMADQVATRR